MSSRWRRPRTKVYDCNFNVAERYYRPVMDSLDRKHGISSVDPVAPLDDRDSTPVSRVSRLLDRESSTGRESVGARASRMMAEFENGVESSHKNRASLLRDEDDEAAFEATMKKIRAARAARNAELEEEFDSIASPARKNKISLADQLLDSVGLNSKTQRSIEEDVFSKQKRAAKKFFEEDDDQMTKWTVVNPAAKALKEAEEFAMSESSASARARKSRAKLQDIDAELEELDRKSAARQKRISDLKALVAENNSDSGSSVKVTKRVTVKQSSEKKQVSF